MLRDAACGKQDRGQTGASMPDWKRGSGLGDRLHGGEVAEEAHQLSQRRAARLIPVDRATVRYEHCRDPQEALRVRLRELAGSRVRYGYRQLTALLKREGWEVERQTDIPALYRGGFDRAHSEAQGAGATATHSTGPCSAFQPALEHGLL